MASRSDSPPSKPATRKAATRKGAATPTEPPALDGKRYYRIGEVSKLTDVKPYVLRYWESEFRGMAPAKSRSKQRLYRKKDIEVILLIKKLLYEQRFTIAGARRRLRELGVEGVQEELAANVDPRAEVRRFRAELEAIRAAL